MSGFKRIGGNAGVELVLPLSDSTKDTRMKIPPSKPRTPKEQGGNIFQIDLPILHIHK